MVAPIFHNKCNKNQPKGILDADLHHLMWCSTNFPALLLVLIRVAHQVPSQVRFLVVCLVLGQVLHPVVFPALLLVLHQVGVLNFHKNGQGYGNISWFIWPLHCMDAPIFHNKCSKNQPKGILNAFLHLPM